MTEWTVVVVISSLLGMGAIIIRPIIKLNTTITILNETVCNLKGDIEEIARKNTESHTRLWEKCGEHDKTLVDHENRICWIEKDRGI